MGAESPPSDPFSSVMALTTGMATTETMITATTNEITLLTIESDKALSKSM
jgi:hypothetical protein